MKLLEQLDYEKSTHANQPTCCIPLFYGLMPTDAILSALTSASLHTVEHVTAELRMWSDCEFERLMHVC